MGNLTSHDARDILTRAHVPIGGNFFSLSQSDVAALLAEADKHKYRAPRNANGSRGRYWHDYLQRVAAKRD